MPPSKPKALLSTSDVSTETNPLPASGMVTAGSKVAPLNPVTVPRQELMGAILVLGLTVRRMLCNMGITDKREAGVEVLQFESAVLS